MAGTLAFILACTPDAPMVALPGSDLRVRVEARLDAARADLRKSIGHYGLVYEVSQEELHAFMAQIIPRRDGPDLVMTAIGGIELHGGGVLDLIARLWRPDQRPAELADAYPFRWSKRPIALQEIYDSMRMQIFSPARSIRSPEATAPFSAPPGLPRMRVEHAAHGRLETTELDAYSALGLLVRYERDLSRSWTNRIGQKISAAALLDSTWNHYVLERSAEEEFVDHSYLHLVEILLRYNRRLDRNLRRDPNSLKRRLLSVELNRTEYGGYDVSEALGHYVESLGFLLAEPDVTWTPAEKMKIRAWLRDLETVRLHEIADAPVQHLSHLLAGLRRIEMSAGRLQ